VTSAASVPQLHLPEEPSAKRTEWYGRILDGEELTAVVTAEDGIAAWLYSRWQALAGAGVDRAAFTAQAVAYRRELWLWLHGDRTWEQCCSGLIGRVERHALAATAG
jgi:hypothetical protein